MSGEAERDGIWGTLAVDARGVYYTLYNVGGLGEHAVARMPRDGGTAQILWAGPELALFGQGLVVDDGVFFYAASEAGGNAVWAVPADGGSLDALAAFPQENSTNSAIAVGPDAVYVSIVDRVVTVSRTGGVSETVLAPARIRSLAFAGTKLYVLTDAELMELGDNGTLVALAPIGGTDVAIHEGTAYVRTPDAVVGVALDSGAQTMITTGLEGPGTIVADASGIYVGASHAPPASTSSVLWIRPGSTPVVLADDVAASALALDATSVYWAGLGQLGRIDKCLP